MSEYRGAKGQPLRLLISAASKQYLMDGPEFSKMRFVQVFKSGLRVRSGRAACKWAEAA